MTKKKNAFREFGKQWWASLTVLKYITIFSYRVETALSRNQSWLAIKK